MVESRGMDLFLRCDHTDPPVGRLGRLPRSGPRPADDRTAREGSEFIEFSGWLGLLRALSDALRASDDERAGHRHP